MAYSLNKKKKGLRGITVNLAPPKPDHHCLPTGETVNTLADILGEVSVLREQRGSGGSDEFV